MLCRWNFKLKMYSGMHNDNMHHRRFATLYRIRGFGVLLLLLLCVHFSLARSYLFSSQILKYCKIIIITIITMKMRLFIKLSVVVLLFYIFPFFLDLLAERHIFRQHTWASVSYTHTQRWIVTVRLDATTDKRDSE